MSISHQIEAVYQRALRLREQATTNPIDPALLELALKDLYLVLEELQAVDAELHQQNQMLSDTRYQVDLEHQRYRTLFELAPDGYLVTDATGKIYHANRAAEILFALPQAGLVGKPLVVLIEQGDWSEFQRRLARPNPAEPWEVSLKSRQGEPVTAAIATNFLKASRRETTTILWSLRDISQQRRIEQQLQAAHADLEGLVAARTAELMQANAQLCQDLSDCRQGRPQ
ncbi:MULTISPECIES: PAS domain-containing protein [Cyanophyceae]|uniref:PAS domain-containing protein n=1 Tax=Cyanophyceae TaxID=3028117 RepID=UPI001689EABB|nr:MULTISPECIES: PAS domain-containing protein [Cyanophyceae]MBD1915246.1 PAS domain-containing protein [Phormidium sp. FACHB-77]MBD2032477.1 PAS domain-containing protein [Phormidium sp. FACHB-322]MBD2050992.1 PAS domain-containing protein [Leptolyngbya sp. FACHB-60]